MIFRSLPVSDGAGKSDSKTQVVGGNTIVGSITLFMENLNLSYREVYEDLPYLLLLLMSADKPRAVYEDKEKTEVKKMSGKDLMRQKEEHDSIFTTIFSLSCIYSHKILLLYWSDVLLSKTLMYA